MPDDFFYLLPFVHAVASLSCALNLFCLLIGSKGGGGPKQLAGSLA